MIKIIRATFFLIGFSAVPFVANIGLAQDCPPGKQYPYTFCVGGTTRVVRCSSCPTHSDQGTPLAPGMPDCKTVTNNAGVTGLTSWASSSPCDDRLVTVWQFSNLDDNATAALSNWADICPSVPISGCCWEVKTTRDAAEDIAPFTSNGDQSTPAVSTFSVDNRTCKASCATYETFLNFSDDYLKDGDFQDEDEDGNPCDVLTSINTWFDPEDAPDPSLTNSFIIYLNIQDVLTHELGHILGVPEEANFPSACPLTGIMHGSDQNGGDVPDVGLPSDDDVRCWFKQLYCPAPCTDAVAAQQPAPTFDLGQPYPSPLSGGILNIPYTIGTVGNINLALYDVLGKQVGNSLDIKTIPGNYNYPFNCASLASGSYYVRLSLEGYPLTKRVEIMHDR